MATRVRDVPLGRFHWPAEEGTWPGLVLIHDVWGPSEHSRELAAAFAAEGFGVLEIDLYRELDASGLRDPGEWIRSLSDPRALADLDRGADWLATTTECRGRRVGVVGVCMGGTYALLAACSSDRFAAAAPFYGILSYDAGMLAGPTGRDRERKPRSPIEAAGGLRVPLLASFGVEDAFVPQADVDALTRSLAQSGQPFEIDRYEGAGHAFLNRTRPGAYCEEAASRAWSRVVPFLRRSLA
ncbi:MAG: dienelactone hydrolase family protein [Myxococcales bacterium]|nr:dienelactone hydrolase family protein [Myxococcales bacterium]